MKTLSCIAALALAASASSFVSAQEAAPVAPAVTPPIQTVREEISAVFKRVGEKMRQNKRTATDLADEIGALEALMAKHKGEKSDEAADILYAYSAIYGQVLGDEQKGKALLQQVIDEYPGTKPAMAAKRTLASLNERAEAGKRSAALVGKAAPEITFKWSTQSELHRLSDLKGKVVLVDFWATWCGPCIASFPELREITAHYQGKPVVVLGVTSIQGRVSNLEPTPIATKGDPEREMKLTSDFIKAKDMTWSVAFSDQPVFNPDYGVVGIPHLTLIAPDGTVRQANLHGSSSEKVIEKIDALLKEFPEAGK